MKELRPFLLVVLLLIVAAECAYSPKIAHELAYMSSIAYEPLASINAWNCTKCRQYPLEHVKGFGNSVGDLQGFAGFSKNLNGIVLAFRGSSNIQNWIINLSTNQVTYSKCSGCKVHNGFYTAWNLAKGLVNPAIDSLRALHRGAPIYVTGHSLGGAIATLSVPDLKETHGGVHSLITFGQPRVGNSNFSQYYSSVIQSLRVVHYADMVPHNPPAAFSFLHQGHQIWYDKSMKSYQVCSYGESASCSNSLSVTSLNPGDHSMDTYITLPASYLEQITKALQEEIQTLKIKMTIFLNRIKQGLNPQSTMLTSAIVQQ